MKFMMIIALWIDSLFDWAAEETNEVKRFIKIFIAGFVDGWEYGCLIIGNIVCLAGAIIPLVSKLKKREG